MILESARLRRKKRAVYILNSLAGIGKSTAGSRQAASEALRLQVYDRVALYGANVFFKYLSNLIVLATGMMGKVKYFETKNEAERWLIDQARH